MSRRIRIPEGQIYDHLLVSGVGRQRLNLTELQRDWGCAESSTVRGHMQLPAQIVCDDPFFQPGINIPLRSEPFSGSAYLCTVFITLFCHLKNGHFILIKFFALHP